MKFRFTRAVRRRAACIGLSAALCASFAAGQLTAFADNGGTDLTASASDVYSLDIENANGKIDLTQIKLDNLSKDVIKDTGVSADVYSLTRTVIVTLKGEPLSERGYAGKSAQAEIAEEQQAFLSELKRAGISYEFKSSYSSIANAVAIDVQLSELSQIKKIRGVSTVSVGSTYARPKVIKETDGAQKNDSNIYASGIYNSGEWVNQGYNGSGMSVAILDTGLDYTHEAFKSAPDTVRYTSDDIQSLMSNTEFKATQRSGATVDDVYISAKVPFAYDYADSDSNVYPSYSQHGTHVAGIVAGKADSYTDKNGNTAVDEDDNVLEFSGVAPEAQLVICKVFSDNLDDPDIGGAEAVDILDALEDCYNLNVDVINMSLGTSAGFSSKALCPSDLKEEDEEGYLMKQIYQRIRDKGISLIVAASNEYSAGFGSAFGTNLTSNPDSGTVGSPSTITGALSVASINGQYSSYITATPAGETASTAIYFEESRNEDSDPYDFVNEMLALVNEGKTGDEIVSRATFRYVVVPGTGASSDFALVANSLKNKQNGEKVIAVIKRGSSSFKDKISVAISYGADAVIVYNNVSGTIRMSLGDMRTRVPAISVTLDAGLTLTGDGRKSGGTITVDRSYSAGPFMNDYSSWGATPDLKLKPDVTSHGGEITSTVAGGYDEMSGTSMACPNLAGFEAVFKGYLKQNHTELWKGGNESTAITDDEALALTKLTNNIVMSTATTVYDQNKLPYSPRKQGAGLATLANVFSTKAYLYTDEADGMCEDGRPKAELGDDPQKNGVYTVKFHVRNFGDESLAFKTNSIFFTETVGKDKMSVAEMAYLLNGNAQWKVAGSTVAEGGTFEVAPGGDVKIEVTLTLTNAEKNYLDKNFKNGMFVEGFLQLISQDGAQCDLNLPFMGFYGDWKAAPMMDLTCFDVAEDARDTSLDDEERAQPQVWATQAYGYYSGYNYTIPLGSFLYVQDEAKEHTSEYVYTEEEHIAISRDFHRYYGDDDPANYLTTTGIKALYAGLLRNAEVVTYTLTNVDTGEIIADENGNETRVIYRAGKAYASGGSAIPSQVLLELKTEDMGLAANGKYRFDFKFYFDYEDYKNYIDGDEDAFTYVDENGEKKMHGVYADNSFSMNFYVDYEAPVLVDSRIRFQNMKDSSNRDYQKVYLDLDIFDNHYPEAVVLCYSEDADGANTDMRTIKLATDYIIPIVNPAKNTVNTVSIDISDYYDQYGSALFVEIDDYALNHNTYYLDLRKYSKTTAVCPGDFKLTFNGEEVGTDATLGTSRNPVSIDKNTAVKFGLEYSGDADMSNFGWDVDDLNVAKVKNGEVFAVGAGKAILTVTGGRGENGKIVTKTVWIQVADTGKTVTATPRVSFGTVINSSEALVKGDKVKVNSGQQFTLKTVVEPWYYPVENLEWTWSSGDTSRATVDENGNVKVIYEGDYTESVVITASAKPKGASADSAALCRTQVELSIQPSFTVSGTTLTKYRGMGGVQTESITVGGKTFENVRVLKFPENKSILEIGEEAFKDCENVEVVIIPKSVTTIRKRAFKDCRKLKAICFIDVTAQEIPDSSLTLIHRYAFSGCENLTVVDLSNCKVFTLDREVFAGCAKLEKVDKMTNIGTMFDGAFAGCTSLESADISQLYIAGSGIFSGCTSLTQVTTGSDTVIGTYMFSGCTSLETVNINCASIGAGAFTGCTNLQTVNYYYEGEAARTIGARAFENCQNLTGFTISGKAVAAIADYAFRNCVKLDLQDTTESFNPELELGYGVFQNVPGMNSAIISDNTLLLAPAVINSGFANGLAAEGVTVIGPNAFSNSTMASGVDTIRLTGITRIGAGAFNGLVGLKEISLPDGLTEIADNAFAGTSLETIAIPASVKTIGAGAFADCSRLASIEFADGSQLKNIGARAFHRTAITTLELPDGVETICDEAFARCSELTEVTINSVKTMGSRVFALCGKLTTAIYGANAQSTGEYTFSNVGYGYNMSTGEIGVTEFIVSALTTVEFGDRILKIGNGLFAYDESYACDKLTQIDLNNVTQIGEYAFAGCTALEAVTGIGNVKVIGAYAFEGCTALTSLDLSAAEEIYPCAFQMAANLSQVTFGNNLQGIGDYAFYITSLSGTVAIPASCTYVGSAAFGRTNLTAIEVAEGSENYVSVNGVLYRYIVKSETEDENVYELVIYPTNKTSDTVNGTRTYRVIDGTVSILDYAFNAIDSNYVRKVILPHTLKVIGHGAFLNSSVTIYSFESIQAPTLLQNIMDRTLDENSWSSNSFFYTNFGSMQYDDYGRVTGTYLTTHAVKYPGDAVSADVTYTLSIEYPSNGMGYENYIYSGFFGNNKTLLAEQPEDSTRTLKKIIESFAFNAETVKGWNKNNVDEATVKEFSETVKQAHALYNGLNTEAQTAYVTQANIDKLFEVEAALKQVKKLFGIQPKISTVVVDSNSTHRTAYTEGERFSINGVKLLVTYDDYSTEIINAESNFKVSDIYNRTLKITDRTVILQGLGSYAGRNVRVSITVSNGGTGTTPGGDTPSGGSGNNGGEKLSGGVIAAIVIGVVVVLGAAAVAVIIVLRKRGAVASDGAKADEIEEADEAEEQTAADEEVTEENNQQENSGEDKADD